MLPHIQNSEAGRNKYDVLYRNIFEVYFTLPDALRAKFGHDEALLTEHVLSVGFGDALDREPEASVKQKFMGTTRSFLAAGLDDTSAEITVKLSLNLRNGIDNYIYRLFKAWGKLNLDMSTGEKSLKVDYLADWLKIKVGNRHGDVYREIIFKDVILSGTPEFANGQEYDYDAPGDIGELTVKFVSDWWDELDPMDAPAE